MTPAGRFQEIQQQAMAMNISLLAFRAESSSMEHLDQEQLEEAQDVLAEVLVSFGAFFSALNEMRQFSPE